VLSGNLLLLLLLLLQRSAADAGVDLPVYTRVCCCIRLLLLLHCCPSHTCTLADKSVASSVAGKLLQSKAILLLLIVLS
jgi:hypothetical protein